MSAPLIIPDHIRRARTTLLCAGFKCEVDDPAFAALMFAAIAYNDTPQFNRAAELELELQAAKRENDRLARELLREVAQANHLRQRLGLARAA